MSHETDVWNRFARLSDRIQPYSASAIAIAVASVATATALRLSGGWVDSDLPFETYLPAVLITCLLAGIPAAFGVMFVSIAIVDWAFIPPYYEITWPLSDSHQVTILWYVLSCLLTIFFAHCCRAVLRMLRDRDLTNQILAQELAHRGRNLLSTIQAVVHMTLSDDPVRAKKLLGRLRAITYANELQADLSYRSITLQDVLRQEFAAYDERSLNASGPEFEVDPKTARHLQLLFHELVTNCAKYGSLSSAQGRVVVAWRRDGPNVTLTWTETGGPPAQRPTKEGFGSRLITVCIKALSGSIHPSYSREGFACSMDFRLDQ
jgi:two-component sensor histidine kinase